MNLGMNLHQGMRLEQKLAPQMIQAVNILQMNTLELELAIKEEIETNPLLEVADIDHERPSEATTPEDIAQLDNNTNAKLAENEYDAVEQGMMDNPGKEDIDWEKYFKEGFDFGGRGPEDLGRQDPDDEWERPQTYGLTIQEFLQKQLQERSLSPRIVRVVQYLIDCMGDDGFLQSQQLEAGAKIQIRVGKEIQEVEASALAVDNPDIQIAEDVLQGKQVLETAPQVVREAFHVLQSFQPSGIGARDLRECLLIQAYRIPGFSKTAIAILESHYQLLRDLRYSQIAKQLGVDNNEVVRAVQELSALNPHPAAIVMSTDAPMAVPDLVVIEEKPGKFVVKLKDGSLPRLRINSTYRNLLQSGRTSKDEKRFIKGKLDAANMFIKNVENRNGTMLRVMNAILERQYDFFAKGPEYLKPMILQDIADVVERDPSTVNRVTNGKYVQTLHGVFEIKRFFSAGVTQEDGSEVSNVQVKEAIRTLIAAENPIKPLSDQAIVEALEEQGLKVARRTVNKYREALGILPARVRRQV
jgi:RNA polymerase sigma-54 factor